MSELNFAKTLLQTLDAKPIKYSADHVFDTKTFATRIPFTLPKLPQPPHPPYPKSKPSAIPAPGATRTTPSISLILKSSRNPAITISLSNIDPSTTTIAQLRESIQNELGGSAVVSIEKIKVLHHKKPIPTSRRTVSDVFEGEKMETGKVIEMGVMIMGGVPESPSKIGAGVNDDIPEAGVEEKAQQPPSPEKMDGIENMSSPAPVQGLSGKEVLETDEFWIDLQGYLEQRVKDEAQALRLVRKWKSNWNVD